MEIVVDNRESKIIDYFRNVTETKITVSQLIIGDIILKKNNIELVIIERKTFGDFYNSICSGRFGEQRERLKAFRTANPHVKLIFIVEGLCSNSVPISVFGAIENLVLFHDIFVLNTLSIESTATTIFNLSQKLSKKEISGLIESDSLPVTKKAKIDENMFLLQLALIPGVSRTSATKIVEKYETLHKFLLQRPSVIELATIQINKRKLGEKLGRKIHEVYFIEG